MISGDQKMILLKANLSTGLYLHITVDNSFTVMIQRKKKISCLAIIKPQEVVVDMDLIDWVVIIDRFFDYMDISEKKKMKSTACRLKGGASA